MGEAKDKRHDANYHRNTLKGCKAQNEKCEMRSAKRKVRSAKQK